MTNWPELDRFLRTDPRDVGCEQAMAVLHVYAEAVAAGEDVAQRFPGVLAHLESCGPCAEDVDGVLAAIRAEQG
jgi:hypothetical protein